MYSGVFSYLKLFVIHAKTGTTKNHWNKLSEDHMKPLQSYLKHFKILKNISQKKIEAFDFWIDFELIRSACMPTITYLYLI